MTREDMKWLASLKPNPCNCGWCNVCGFYGIAPKPKPLPKPEPVTIKPTQEEKPKPQAGLFDACQDQLEMPGNPPH